MDVEIVEPTDTQLRLSALSLAIEYLRKTDMLDHKEVVDVANSFVAFLRGDDLSKAGGE